MDRILNVESLVVLGGRERDLSRVSEELHRGVYLHLIEHRELVATYLDVKNHRVHS